VNGGDPGLCDRQRWCEETAGHDGPCRRVLFDGNALDVDTGRPLILQLALQGSTNRTRGLVLTTVRRVSTDDMATSAGMSWPQAASLAAVMSNAIKRWGRS
jgi:hypothetical protein